MGLAAGMLSCRAPLDDHQDAAIIPAVPGPGGPGARGWPHRPWLTGRAPARLRPGRRGAAAGRAAPPGLAEPLTDRELEMLRLIAAGRSNQGIAHDLVVALDTVKSM